MRFTRERMALLALLLLFIAAATWVVRNTEWVDVQVPRTPDRRAAADRLYAAKVLLGALGVNWSAPDNLDRLPPPGATLVLMSSDWKLFPGREAALKRFVMDGGHLVVTDSLLDGKLLGAWVPVTIRRVPYKPPAAGRGTRPAVPDDGCRVVHEAAQGRAAFGTHRDYRVCAGGFRVLDSTAPLAWALDGPDGHDWLTVRLGRGRVSVVDPTLNYGFNHQLPRADTALAFVAALDLRPGAEVWLVGRESRPPWYRTAWENGAAAIVLGGLAVLLALWRGAVRFGPLMAEPAPGRRSMREQIAGTAGFIARDGGSALHRAALRALDEAARARVPGYAALLGAGERAEALACPAAIDPGALASAMNDTLVRSPRELGAALALLDTARRGLRLPSTKDTT